MVFHFPTSKGLKIEMIVEMIVTLTPLEHSQCKHVLKYGVSIQRYVNIEIHYFSVKNRILQTRWFPCTQCGNSTQPQPQAPGQPIASQYTPALKRTFCQIDLGLEAILAPPECCQAWISENDTTWQNTSRLAQKIKVCKIVWKSVDHLNIHYRNSPSWSQPCSRAHGEVGMSLHHIKEVKEAGQV